MAIIMNKRILISLLFAASTLISSQIFAESPAMMDGVDSTSDIEPVFIDSQDDARPAAEDNTTRTSEVETETVETGTVLDTVDNTGEPMLVRQLDFPRRGMSEDKVKNELGSPSEVKPAIGKPPISQWVYDDRIVYFEYATVLHVVAK